jgi:hypothetical protein
MGLIMGWKRITFRLPNSIMSFLGISVELLSLETIKACSMVNIYGPYEDRV